MAVLSLCKSMTRMFTHSILTPSRTRSSRSLRLRLWVFLASLGNLYRKSFLCKVGVLLLVSWMLVSLCTLTILVIAVSDPIENYEVASVYAGQCLNSTSRKGATFPRHIHQTWKDYNVPEKWKKSSEACKKLNPDYKYTLWSDRDLENFISKEYPWFIEQFRSYPYPIQRVDAARYFILHKYGGMYIDLDITCREPFDNILKNVSAETDSVLGATAPLGVTNSMLISKAQHPFMEFTMRRLQVVNRWYVLPYWTIMLTTGPLFVWRNYLQYPCKEQVHILSVHQHTTVYFNHTHGSSWHTWDGPIMVWFDNHGRVILSSLAVIIPCIIIYLLLKRYYGLSRSTMQNVLLPSFVTKQFTQKKTQQNGHIALL